MSVTLLHGDCVEQMQNIKADSIDCVVTSPPYWGLRDYGVEGQLGAEETPQEFVDNLVNVFRGVRRVLKDEGTVWLNLGDSYYNYRPGKGSKIVKQTVSKTDQELPSECSRRGLKQDGLKEKDIVGIPWRVAFALQADGWFLRQDIIWSKPNPMPESVKDRCTKSHEYIFLLTKSKKYFFNDDLIKEKSLTFDDIVRDRDMTKLNNTPGRTKMQGLKKNNYEMKKKRSVWHIATRPYRGAHFATYPPELVEPCILAGCPDGGTVLDPFGGTGTTAAVAMKFGRKAILIELSEKNCNLIENRIRTITPVFPGFDETLVKK